MKRSIGMILAMVLAIAMMGMSASAMPIQVSEGTFQATGTKVSDETSADVNAAIFQLLGTDENGDYLLFVDQAYVRVSASDIQPVLDSIGAEAAENLPKISDYEPLARYNRGEAVMKMQSNLQRLGYMSGTADGDFGGQSETAIRNFQRAFGLEETGEADALLQMLMDSMTSFSRVVDMNYDPSERFAAISGKTDANLDKAIELNLSLTYDDISGVGMITNSNVVNYSVPALSDIDSRSFTIRFGLGVEQNGDGTVVITPVADVTCIGVQRPVMQEIIFKSGDERSTLTIDNLINGISGLYAQETARIPLDAETIEMLANASEEGELKIRIGCKYDSYDISVAAGNLASISAIGEAALGLNQ